MHNSTMPAFIPVGLVVAFLGIGTWIAIVQSKKSRANIARLALQLGLAITTVKSKLTFLAPPSAGGTIRGKSVRLYTYTTGSDKSRTIWAAVGVTPSAGGDLEFEFSPRNFATHLRELFGAKEVKTGDAAFDKKWFITSNAPDFFAQALLPEIQAKIDALPGRVRMKDGEIVYSEQGTFSNTARCERIPAAMDLACDLADLAEVHASS